MKTISPKKIIIELGSDWSVREAILLYQVSGDAAARALGTFNSIGIASVLSKETIDTIVAAVKEHSEKGESIDARPQ